MPQDSMTIKSVSIHFYKCRYSFFFLNLTFCFRLFEEVFKADVQDEAQSQIERITSEKELWENKYEQKRKALKEIE